MLSILLNWLYMAVLVFFMGMLLMQGYTCLMKKINKQDSELEYGISHVFPYLDNKDDLDELVVGDTLRGGFYIEK